MAEKNLLTIKKIALRLGITEARGYELARANILPVVRLGRQIRIDPDALEEFIKQGGQALPGGWKREANN
jgi:excisionase family DNA binding protein